MVDDTDPRIVWRGIGRGLDRCYPPEAQQQPDDIAELLEALRQRDRCGDAGTGSPQ